MTKIQPINNNKHNYPNFKCRKVATAKPIVDGVVKEIEVFRIGKADAKAVKSYIERLNFEKMLPQYKDKPNFSVWEGLLNLAAEDIGTFSKQKAFLAVADKKPCAIILTNGNRKEGTLGILTSIPIAVGERVKGAARTLMTTFLDLANSKKIKKLKLEPILNGPTDAVSFYEKHNFRFADSNSSQMQIKGKDILDTLVKNIQELNYQKFKKQPERNLEAYINS